MAVPIILLYLAKIQSHFQVYRSDTKNSTKFNYMCLYFTIFLPHSLFSFFWLHWVSFAARGLSLVVVSGGYSSLRCMGFSLQWLLLLQSTATRHVGFNSCSTRAQQLWHTGQFLCSMWDVPGPGLEPASPALAGILPTTAPPGKPRFFFFFNF